MVYGNSPSLPEKEKLVLSWAVMDFTPPTHHKSLKSADYSEIQ